MSLDISYYRKISNSYNGTSNVTKKESEIYSLKKHIAETFNDSLDFHDDTLKNGVSQNFVVSYHTDSKKKKITAYPDDELNIGDMIDCFDLKWLVMELNADNTVFTKGVMQKCNYILPFQTNSSTIYNEPCIVLTQSEATSGEDQGSVITISDTQRVIYVQYNERTKYLIEGKRIFIDQNVSEPKVYKITKVDRICYMDGENGLWKLICDEDTVSKNNNDNKQLKIADYISTDTSTVSTSTDTGSCYITNTSSVVYTATKEIKVGGSKVPLMAQFKDASANIVSDVVPVWSLSGLTTEQLGFITLDSTTYTDRVLVWVSNENSMIGITFILNLTTSDGLYGSAQLQCKAVSLT